MSPIVLKFLFVCISLSLLLHFMLFLVIHEMTDLTGCSSLDTVLVLLHQVLIKNTVITVVVGSVGTSLLHQEHGPSIGHDGRLAEDVGGGEEEEEKNIIWGDL